MASSVRNFQEFIKTKKKIKINSEEVTRIVKTHSYYFHIKFLKTLLFFASTSFAKRKSFSM